MQDRAHKIQHIEDAACMKCGFCKAVCPVFTDTETTSPRAKVRLAKAVATGEMALTAGIKTQVARCVNCRACAAECPSGVEPNRIVLAMREALVERHGLPLVKRLIFRGGLRRPRLMALGSRALGLGQKVSLIHSQRNPLRRLLPAVGMRRDKDLPLLGKRSLFSLVPEINEPVGQAKATVVYFPGCAINLLYPEMGLAAVSVLRKLGARVLLPRGLVCCSTPVFNAGDVAGAVELARRNIDILSAAGTDFVVTSCGSCGLTISNEWAEILKIREAEAFRNKVLDVCEFVARCAPDRAISQVDLEETVTYHDSCHLRRGMGVHEEPRQLLSASLGQALVEMELADRCCGGGGAFCLYQPQLSQTIAEIKMQCVADSGAGTVATGCPACVMQIRDSALHRKMDVRSLHTIEIIDRALRAGG